MKMRVLIRGGMSCVKFEVEMEVEVEEKPRIMK